jgi:hypothetical protein
MQSVVPETRQLDEGFLLSFDLKSNADFAKTLHFAPHASYASFCIFVLNQMLTSQTHYILHRMLLMRLSGYYRPNIASIPLSLL